jgi:hypothetical protein
MATAAFVGCSPKFRVLPGDLNEEMLNLDDVFSTSIFEEIVGFSEAICRVTAQATRLLRAMPLF